MADNPNDPNKIDISLSLLGGSDGVEFRNFVQELRNLRESVRTLATDMQTAVEASQRLAQGDAHTAASRPTVLDRTGQPINYASSGLKAAQAAAEVRAADEAVTEELPIVSEENARSALGRYHRRHGGGDGGSRPPDGPSPTDEEEEEALPGREKPLRGLHYGEYNPQEVLYALGRGTRGLAGKAGGDDSFAGDKLGGVSEALFRAGDKVPIYQATKQYVNRLESQGIMGYEAGPQSLAASGSELGYSGQSGPFGGSSIGPIRMPFLNDAAIKALQEQFEMFKRSALTPGINHEQEQQIVQSLYQRGYQPGTSGVNQMRTGMESLMKNNPALAENSDVQDMMDKATRYGSDSIRDMVATIQGIPDAAHKANVSLEQMSSDMNAFGSYVESQGGMPQTGYKAAKNFTRTTGLPASVLQQGMENQFVQANLASQLGMPPGMLGAASPDMYGQSLVQSVNTIAGGIGTPGDKRVPIGKTGQYQTISGHDQMLAQLHAFFPQLSAPTLQALTDPRKRNRMLGGMNTSELMTEYSHNVGATGHSHINLQSVENSLTQMEGSRAQGRKDMDQIMAAGRGKTGAKAASAEYNATQRLLQKRGADLTNPNASSTQPKVTIGLNQQAQKIFGLSTDTFRGQNKAAKNSGQAATIVMPFGPSQIPPLAGQNYPNGG